MAERKSAHTGKGWPEAPLDIVDVHRLVGCFMASWAQLETVLDVAIRRILKIEVVAMSILSVNLQMVAKIYTARCAISVFGKQEASWQKGAQKVLVEIGKMSELRNMVAHTYFGISADKTAVEFYRIKATSKLTTPDEFWTPDDFSTHVMVMSSLGAALQTVMNETMLHRSQIDMRERKTQESIARILMGQDPPPQGGWNALLGIPVMPPNEAENSDSAHLRHP